ncbi:MAG TPA: PQQ-binding-like beta-propeller repeat protein, partial [Stellaceae bacterium]|nr:PQQ-binding-like beta-propeller repeat protein [Stellaceae bacterium]
MGSCFRTCLRGAVALAILPFASADPALAEGFRGDAIHSGIYATTAPIDAVRIRWQVATAGAVRSSPLVAGGIAYFGSGDGIVRAVDLSTGRERWRYATGGSVSSSPAGADGAIYVLSGDRFLYALGAADGHLRWRTRFGEDKPYGWGWDYFLSSPLVDGGRVYVGGGDGALHALDAATGKPLWQAATGGRVRSSPALAGGTLYVGSMDGNLYAVDSATGRIVWRSALEGASLDSDKAGYDRRSIISSPAVAGDTIVVGSRDGKLYGLDRG